MIGGGFLRNIGVGARWYSSEVRVRFAPSPTGHLHLGGLRTALYNFLFTKQHGGKFILRIEDTDQTRLVAGAAEKLQNDLKWTGIEIDEGPQSGGDRGPYVQSERIKLYKEQVDILLENGSAYRCFCTDKRLDLLRREAVKLRQMPKYDNRCRHLKPEEIDKRISRGDKYCIRFKLLPDCETFEDLIYGNIAYDVGQNEGDPVIMKSDGFPTYHFANVVDDHFMEISHVLRGVEWQISTTKHILMYRALNWEPPQYGHLPLLMNADGTKLSKRQGDIQISNYRSEGVLPQAIINFITKSGGGFEKDLEQGVKSKSYTMQELVDQFNVENIKSHSGRLMSDRLWEFNRLELERQLKDPNEKKKLISEVQTLVKHHFSKDTTNLQIDDFHISYVLEWSLNRINRLSDLVSRDLRFLWVVPDVPKAFDDKQVGAIKKLSEVLQENELKLQKQEVNAFLKDLASENGIAFNALMKSLRTVLSGLKEGPSVAEMMEILGRDNTRMRLQLFLNQQL